MTTLLRSTRQSNTRYYYVVEDRSLFKVCGGAMRESFDELRKHSRHLTFKCVQGHWVAHMRKAGAFSREIEMVKQRH